MKPIRFFKWFLGLFGLLLCAPILSSILFLDFKEVVRLSDTIYFSSLLTTLKLCLWVLLFGALLAAIPAWVLSQSRHRHSAKLMMLLMVSMAIPSSVYAAWLIEMLQQLGLSSRGFLRLPMAGLALAASHFAYLFIPLYLHFQKHFGKDERILSSLGLNTFERWKKVHFPKLSPVILLGGFLLILETWSNFEVAQTFNVVSISIAIYRQSMVYYQTELSMWMSLFSALPPVFLIIWGLSKWKKAPLETNLVNHYSEVKVSKIFWSWTFIAGGLLVLCPMGSLLWWTMSVLTVIKLSDLGSSVFNSLYLALASFLLVSVWSVSTVAIAAYTKRKSVFNVFMNFGIYQYGFSSLSLGLIILAWPIWKGDGNWLISETSLGLIWGHSAKVLALATLLSFMMFKSIPKTVYHQLSSLGFAPIDQIFKILLPWRVSYLVCMAFLCFIYSIRELPITYLLQPFDFPTLATKINQYVIEGDVLLASPYCLIMCLVSLYPVLWVSLKLQQGRT